VQTFNHIGRKLWLRDFGLSDLYGADIVSLFGSQCLKNLFEEFGTWQAVATAYKGGKDCSLPL
jgi:hypothetical protein